MDLDHVALATRDVRDALDVLVGELGGTVLFGGNSVGFRPMQLRLGDATGGMNIELLEPWDVERNDFLERFVARHGAGPHHLTFKVDDLAATLERVRSAGYRPVNVDLSDPDWKEAFLHPRDATGVLVQLAQSEGEWRTPAPASLPAPRTPAPADMIHVAHAVASLDDGLRLFSGLLGGSEEARGRADHHRWVDVAWPAAGRVRLVAPSSEGSTLWSWLGGRAGRLSHLGFVCEDPGGVGGARALTGSAWSLAPADNLGTGLVLVSPGSAALDDGLLP